MPPANPIAASASRPPKLKRHRLADEIQRGRKHQQHHADAQLEDLRIGMRDQQRPDRHAERGRRSRTASTSLKSSSFHIDGSVEICATDRTDQHQRHRNRRRQHVEPDPQRHQRGAEAGKAGDEAAGERAEQAESRRWRRSISFLRHSGAMRSIEPGISRFPESRIRFASHRPGMTIVSLRDVYTTRRTGTIAIEAFNNNLDGNGPMSSTPPKTFLVCHGAWSAGWAWKKMHPLMQAAGHRLVTPTYTGLGERAHLANPSIDLETHIQDILNVIKYEDLRDIVLIGHSYGGMVATGVADRARDRVAQLIYLDAFVPDDGQSLLDLNEVGAAAHAGAGEDRRWLARAAEPDAAGYAARRCRMADRAPRRHADQMFRDEAQAAGRRADLAAQLHLRHAHHAGRHLRAVRQARPKAIRAGAITRSTPAIRRTSPRRKR